MAGGAQGILRRVPSEELALDPGTRPEEAGDLYEESSANKVHNRTFRDAITLPYDGLFVSGDHKVELSGGATGE
jgi:hypothetical protein